MKWQYLLRPLDCGGCTGIAWGERKLSISVICQIWSEFESGREREKKKKKKKRALKVVIFKN